MSGGKCTPTARLVFVPAGANHQFIGYEQLSVLVIFEKHPR